MKEIQGKSTLVRVSARSELASVQVIGSELYLQIKAAGNISDKKGVLTSLEWVHEMTVISDYVPTSSFCVRTLILTVCKHCHISIGEVIKFGMPIL